MINGTAMATYGGVMPGPGGGGTTVTWRRDALAVQLQRQR